MILANYYNTNIFSALKPETILKLYQTSDSLKNDLDRIYELYKLEYNKESEISLFDTVCEKGLLKLLKQFDFDIMTDDEINWGINISCLNGHVQIAKYLYSLKRSNNQNRNRIFIWCCESGHLDCCKWLYNLGCVDICKIIDKCLKLSCNQEIINWLNALKR